MQQVEMKLAKYTLTSEEIYFTLTQLDKFGRRIRMGWLREWMHRMSYYFGHKTHNWLISSLWYRWWGRQVYGPSLFQEQAETLKKQIDNDIIEAIYHGTKRQ